MSKMIDVGQKGYQNFTLLLTVEKQQHLFDLEMLLVTPNIQNLINETFNQCNDIPQPFPLQAITVSIRNKIDTLHIL